MISRIASPADNCIYQVRSLDALHALSAMVDPDAECCTRMTRAEAQMIDPWYTSVDDLIADVDYWLCRHRFRPRKFDYIGRMF